MSTLPALLTEGQPEPVAGWVAGAQFEGRLAAKGYFSGSEGNADAGNGASATPPFTSVCILCHSAS